MPTSRRKSAKVQVSKQALKRILDNVGSLLGSIAFTHGDECGLDPDRAREYHRYIDKLTLETTKKPKKR